jgi:hypothetical protein
LTHGPSHLLPSIGRGAAGDGIVLAQLVGPLQLHRRLAGTSPALLVDPEGPELRRERRHRGGAHHLAPRATGRPTQLGLSLLLAARRDLDADCALMSAGYREGAQAWRAWLQHSVAGSPHQLQIMYGLSGERRLLEWEVPWLPGYEGAAPVRIGKSIPMHVATALRRLPRWRYCGAVRSVAGLHT